MTDVAIVNVITEDQTEVVAFLESPVTHGGLPVERIDTHASIIFLAGMPIRIVYQPVLLAPTDPDHVMVEVHTDVYRRAGAPELEVARRLRELNAEIVDLETLDEILRHKAGRGISLERRIRQPDPTSTW